MALGIVGTVVGTVVGAYFGQPQWGMMIGSLVGQTAGGLLEGDPKNKGIRSSDVAVQVSTYGHPINKVWGSMVVAGDLIWVGKRLKKEKRVSSKGGFGGTGSAYTVYRQSFMVGISEPVADVLKIWMDAKLIYDKTGKAGAKKRYSSLKIRFYYGSDTQQPDELIEAERGIGHVPGFRHLNAIMFENLPLRDYGNRIPNVRALVVSKLGETTGKKTVQWVTGFEGNLQRDSLAPSRTGRPLVFVPGSTSNIPRTRFHRVNIETAAIELHADTGYRWGSFSPGDSAAVGGSDVYYYNAHKQDCTPTGCIERTLTHVRTAMAGFPTNTFLQQVVACGGGATHTCLFATMPPGGEPWQASGLYRANQYMPRVYQISTGDGNHGRLHTYDTSTDIITWAGSSQTTSGGQRVHDLDADAGGNIYVLKSDGSTTFVNTWDITAALLHPTSIRWIPQDDTLVLMAVDRAVKISTVDGSVLKTLALPLRINTNLASMHGNISPTGTLWFATIVRDGTAPRPPGTYDFMPAFLEINVVTLTHVRTVIFPEAGMLYPLPSGKLFFSPQNALYYPDQETLVAEEESRQTIGIFRLNDGGGATVGECPTLQEVVEEICLMTGKLTLAQIDATALASDRVCGFVNDNQRPARELLEMLLGAYFANARERDGKIEFLKRNGAPLLTIPATDLAAHEEGDAVPVTLKEMRQQEIELPRDVQMIFINPDRDYEQDSVQEIRNARVVKSTERVTVNVPIVFTQGEARRVCAMMAREHWLNRATYEAMLAPPYQRLDVLDTTTVVLDDNSTRVIRWNEINEGANGLLELKGVDQNADIYTDMPLLSGASGGGHTGVVIPDIVRSTLYLLDTPLMHDTDDGNVLYLAVTPERDQGRWGGAEIVRSIDHGITWDDFTEQPISAVAGSTETILAAPADWTVWDEANTVDVRLTIGELFNASALEVLNLTNAAVVGDEIFQFRTATLLSSVENRYRLSGLLRGRRGTEWAIGSHGVGEPFVLLSADSIKRVTLPLSDFGVQRDYRAITADLTIEDSTLQTLTWEARSLKPYAVAQPTIVQDEADNIVILWVRRSRVGVAWQSGQDPDLAEATEAYEVDVIVGNTVKRTLTTTVQSVVYSPAQQAEDGITTDATVGFAIYQMSAAVGRGFPATVGTVPAIIPVPPLPLPDAPSSLVVTALDSTRIRVAWVLTDSRDEAGVTVQRSLNNFSTYTTLPDLPANTLSLEDTGLTPATQYYYRARTFNDTGVSDWSNTDSDTTDAAPVAVPNAPSSLSVTAMSSSRIDGVFTNNATNESGLEVWRSVSGGAFTFRLSLGINATTFSDTGLTPSTLYAYKVLAKNVAGSSAFSNTASDTTDPSIIVGTGYFFVDPVSGNNANVGNINAPFKTIARALTAGGNVYLRGSGTYTERITRVPSGTSWNAPRIIAAYPGDTVTLQAINTAAILDLVYAGTVIQYVVFDRLIFDGNNVSTFVVNLNGTNWAASNINRIRFLACEVKNATASGVLTGQGVNFLEFIGGSYHDNGTNNGDHGIYLESSDCVIDGGTFYNNAGFGVHIFNGYTTIAAARNNRNIVRRCIMRNNDKGLVLGSGADNQGYCNLIYSNTLDGAQIGYGATATKFYFNTLYDNGGDGLQIRTGIKGTVAKNNILRLNGTDLNNIPGIAAGFTTLANNFTGDPLFVNAGAGDFHLQSGSPCIDAGVAVPTVTVDFDGAPRVVHGVPDIGAYEKQ